MGLTKVPYVEHVPPDVTACIFWLKNRDPEHWRDTQQRTPVGSSSKTTLLFQRSPQSSVGR
jgi:hypothetical protein